MFKFKAEPYYLVKINEKEYQFNWNWEFKTEDSAVAKVLKGDRFVSEIDGKESTNTPSDNAGGDNTPKKLEDMTVAELKKVVEKRKLNMASAIKTKDQILEFLKANPETPEAPKTDDWDKTE